MDLFLFPPAVIIKQQKELTLENEVYGLLVANL